MIKYQNLSFLNLAVLSSKSYILSFELWTLFELCLALPKHSVFVAIQAKSACEGESFGI